MQYKNERVQMFCERYVPSCDVASGDRCKNYLSICRPKMARENYTNYYHVKDYSNVNQYNSIMIGKQKKTGINSSNFRLAPQNNNPLPYQLPNDNQRRYCAHRLHACRDFMPSNGPHCSNYSKICNKR